MSDRDDPHFERPPQSPRVPDEVFGPRLDPWGRRIGGSYPREGWPLGPADGPGPARRPERRPRTGRPIVNAVLFVLTLITTTMAGAMHVGVDPFADPWSLPAGLSFSVPLMLILLSHEFGHYAAALWHGVPTTLPYFIPAPPFLVGTFGAFIRMRGMPRSRQALFDVGAAGPWAGLVVATPAVALGLYLSEVRPLSHGLEGGLSLGSSLLFDGLARLVVGVDPHDATILLHPIALAGWFGILVTFLNLLPVGQLDGGHVIYALLGRRHRQIARVFLLIIIAMGFLGWEGWFVWALMLAVVLRVDHPDTLDPDTPLDPRRKLAAWATIGIFALTFMPVPLSVVAPEMPPFFEQRTAPRRPTLPEALPRPPSGEEERHFDRRGGSLQDVRLPAAPAGRVGRTPFFSPRRLPATCAPYAESSGRRPASGRWT
jgi:membrane-associated protease RseP (regulator of RpoE activity)